MIVGSSRQVRSADAAGPCIRYRTCDLHVYSLALDPVWQLRNNAVRQANGLTVDQKFATD